MPKNKMSDLRNHLFETLEALKDEEKPMEIERAIAISTVAGTIIASVKEETRFMQATGEVVETDFFDVPADATRPRLAPRDGGKRQDHHHGRPGP